MWILGSFQRDFCFFYLPGFIGVALGQLQPDLANLSIVYALFATSFIDSGHVFTTIWRTLLHSPERKSRRGYWLVPMFTGIFFFLWAWLRLPYLWSIVVYATVFHYTRQIFGFTKWTQILNHRSCKWTDRFVYALTILPLIAYHFRTGMPSSYYSDGDILFFPNPTLLVITLSVYGLTLIAWAAFETRVWNQGRREYSRILSIFCTTLLWTLCFVVGKTQTQVLLPLIFSHGTPYMAVTAQSLNRTQGLRFKNFVPTLFIVFLTAAILGGYTEYLEEVYVDFGANTGRGPVTALQAGLIALYLIPIFSHYIFDSWIWKRAHPDSILIYQTGSEPKTKTSRAA